MAMRSLIKEDDEQVAELGLVECNLTRHEAS